MVHSDNMLNKKIKKTYLFTIIGLLIAISLIPDLQANFSSKDNYYPNLNIKKKDKSFTAYVLIAIGKISNPRIEKQDTNKYLIFMLRRFLFQDSIKVMMGIMIYWVVPIEMIQTEMNLARSIYSSQKLISNLM